MGDAFKAVDVVRVNGASRVHQRDSAATEEPLEIRLHGRSFAVIMRTPGADRELAAGFLLAERVITSADDLGVIEQNRGNYREAIVLYQRTTEMNPEYWPAWNNLGNSFLALGESSRALEAYSRTLNLNPDHWPSQYNIAIVHYTAGRFDKAIPRLRSVLEWSPDFRDARYLLAASLARSGEAAEAEREMKKLGHAPAQPPMPAPISAPTR